MSMWSECHLWATYRKLHSGKYILKLPKINENKTFLAFISMQLSITSEMYQIEGQEVISDKG